MMVRKSDLNNEQGFVLATSLILLTLLTLFSVAMYFVGRSAIQTSASAQNTTEAYYYAETALHYMEWAVNNDAEFDSFRGAPVNDSGGVDPSKFPTEYANWFFSFGDWSELGGYLWDPGPTGVAGAGANDTT